MKAYKGFTKEMKCRDFQYEEGGEYEQEGGVKVCEKGFHACEYPLDCLRYYAPANSEYHEVELGGELSQGDDDTKVAASKIKIGARLDIVGLVNASFEYIKENANKTKSNHSKADKRVNSATGDWSANSATGYGSANSATGYGQTLRQATGRQTLRQATGRQTLRQATGRQTLRQATGRQTLRQATGRQTLRQATGRQIYQLVYAVKMKRRVRLIFQ